MWKREAFWVEVYIWRVSINDLRRSSTSLLSLLFRDRCSDITACKNYFRNTKDNERKRNRPISLEKTKYIYFFYFLNEARVKDRSHEFLFFYDLFNLFIEESVAHCISTLLSSFILNNCVIWINSLSFFRPCRIWFDQIFAMRVNWVTGRLTGRDIKPEWGKKWFKVNAKSDWTSTIISNNVKYLELYPCHTMKFKMGELARLRNSAMKMLMFWAAVEYVPQISRISHFRQRLHAAKARRWG